MRNTSGLTKFTQPGDWQFDIEPASIITAGRGLTKRAASLDLKYEKTAGQTDVHLIAVGAGEAYSANRNGDFFKEADCRDRHNTFVKANRALHRHHKNKPKDPKYGNIKAAAFNEDMKRIELIVGHDNDKCADILSEIEKNGHANYSMACRVPYDTCSWCEKKAKHAGDRCEHIPKKLGEMTKEGSLCCMVNEAPNWFEISYVGRPADRIGMSLSKLAESHDAFVKRAGDELYLPSDVLDMPVLLVSKTAEDRRRLLRKLSALEKRVAAVGKKAPDDQEEKYIKEEAPKAVDTDPLSPEVISKLKEIPPARLFKALADHGIVLSADDFFRYVFDGGKGAKPDISKIKEKLPSVFSDIEDDDESEGPCSCGGIANSDMFTPASLGAPLQLGGLLKSLMPGMSLFSEPSQRRIMTVTIIRKSPRHEVRGPMHKESSLDESGVLARQYANYKLAALSYLEDRKLLSDDFLLHSVVQNKY